MTAWSDQHRDEGGRYVGDGVSVLDEIKRLLAEATPGPWEPYGGSVMKPTVDSPLGFVVTVTNDDRDRVREDVALIAALRNNADKLIAVCEAALEASYFIDLMRPAIPTTDKLRAMDDAFTKLLIAISALTSAPGGGE